MTDHTDDDTTGTTPMSRRGVLQATAGAAGTVALGGLAGSAAANDHEGAQLFRIRIENVSGDSGLPTPISPGAFAVHTRNKPFFTGFGSASEGLERLAEDGMPGQLAAEVESVAGVRESGVFAGDETTADPNDPTGDVPGAPPVFPGGAFEFAVAATPGESLSLATMFVQSNDLFLAPDVTGIDLFDGGDPVDGDVSDQLALWDAGTEVDQPPGEGADQAPRQSEVGAGESEDSYVLHTAVARTGGDYPDAADTVRVTVEPVEPQPLRVRVENVASAQTYGDDGPTDGAVWLSPGGAAVHRGANPVFTEGEPASPGLELLAEAGPPTNLVPELAAGDRVTAATAYAPSDTVADPNDPTGEVPGAPPIAPGGAFEVTVDAAPGHRLSLASMFVPSNDLFLSPDAGGIDLFDGDEPRVADVSDHLALWDAGTEPNGEPGGDPDQAPAQDDATQGADEGGVVRSIADVDDGYFYPDADDTVRVTVAPEGESLPSRSVRVRIENVAPTDFYGAEASTGGAIWITPGAFAVHPGPNPIYREGHPASPGLRLLAEAGPPSDLVPELRENARVETAGAYTPSNTVADPNDPTGDVPGAPPIAPGGAFEFTVDARPGHRLSFASMFVPSNDLFLSPAFGAIPLFEDGAAVEGEVVDRVGLWDAGTEPNAERPGYGPDQAPAQDSATQGADEGGVVRSIADVADGHDYPAVEDVLSVTLTPQ